MWQFQFVSQFIAGGYATECLFHLVGHFVKLPDAVHHVHRHADGASLVGDGAGDGLPDPPGGVSGKAESAVIIEFLNRFHQSQVAFLDQVKEGHAAADVTFGHADHQPGIGFDQMFAGKDAVFDLAFSSI